jgi:signal transduction histidine kinase
VCAEQWEALLRTPSIRRPRELDTDLRLDGDRTRPVLLTVSGVPSEDGVADDLLVTVKDMSERLAVQRATAEFVTLASHELRTPLTSVIGFLDLALERLPDGADDRLRGPLDLARRNAGRLGRLVEDVVDLSRGDTGRLRMEMGEVDLGDLLRDAVDAARPAAATALVGLDLQTEPLPAVRGDRHRLRQVLDNVLSNAVKFTPAGGWVTVRADARDGEVRVEVADTGLGIPPEDRERVFERFFRSPEATRRAIPGSGLGLAIARMILEAHGGRIAAEGREGLGSVVRIHLPGGEG